MTSSLSARECFKPERLPWVEEEGEEHPTAYNENTNKNPFTSIRVHRGCGHVQFFKNKTWFCTLFSDYHSSKKVSPLAHKVLLERNLRRHATEQGSVLTKKRYFSKGLDQKGK